MTTLVTKIVYEVDQAIKNLNKLNAEAEKVNKKTEEGFDDSNKASDKWKATLDKLPPSVSKVVTSISRFTTGIGGVTAGIGAAAGAVAALGVQFIDLPGLIGDATAELEQFRTGANAILEVQNLVSSQADARQNRELDLQRRRISLRAADVADEQNASREKIRAINEELEAAKRVTDERESLERRLRDRLASRQGQKFAGLDPDIRAASLLEEATLQARKGNIDAAEDLVSEAESLKNELENHVFFLQASEDANKAIDKAIAGQISKLQANTSELEKQKKIEEDRLFNLTNEATALGAQRRRVRETRREAVEEQDRAEADRTLTANTRILSKEFEVGRSALQNFKDSALQSANALKNITAQRQAAGVAGQAFGAARNIAEAQAAQQRGDITLRQLDETFTREFERFRAETSQFQDIVQSEGLGGFQFDIDKLERITDTLADSSQAIAQLNQAAAAAPGTGAITPTAAPATINVQAEVKGGLIDQEVTTQITDIIRREIRKVTSEGF
jgi:hypothetical protein